MYKYGKGKVNIPIIIMLFFILLISSFFANVLLSCGGGGGGGNHSSIKEGCISGPILPSREKKFPPPIYCDSISKNGTDKGDPVTIVNDTNPEQILKGVNKIQNDWTKYDKRTRSAYLPNWGNTYAGTLAEFSTNSPINKVHPNQMTDLYQSHSISQFLQEHPNSMALTELLESNVPNAST